MICIQEYESKYYERLIDFLSRCLPQSGRTLDLNNHHKIYCDIEHSFECFWCMFDDENMIGTVGIKNLSTKKCELKSLYLLGQYQGMRLGYALLMTAISKAKEMGYYEIYLDTLSSSKKAISLYERVGFTEISRYNENHVADKFMMLKMNI